jgi:SPP1 family predicted phage head-tail adaptor
MSEPEIGALRHRLTIEEPARAADDGGTAIVTWAGIGEAWAAIEPISGREIVAADGLGGRITHEVRLRWRADVTPAHRLRLGTRLFDIRSIIDEGELRRWLVLRCEERVP